MGKNWQKYLNNCYILLAHIIVNYKLMLINKFQFVYKFNVYDVRNSGKVIKIHIT